MILTEVLLLTANLPLTMLTSSSGAEVQPPSEDHSSLSQPMDLIRKHGLKSRMDAPKEFMKEINP